ncbi:MAG TPA: protein-L-isoaspartate(D-aspartate) O-methyltransferase [Rhizomicrobium sp.]|jgi:protein-L-isoaspartate(D-aspartate) O-methyltransferase|nr:protein-L-isoaspartate(D-aspartate) O-methyltransferase [Rhizomicrobium sp.]
MSEDHRPIALVMELRGQGILDQRVLSAIERTPRELFVEEPFQPTAYENIALPIACGQTISQPYIVAYMTEALEVDPKHRVLEIGTGSGYQAAVLAPLCRMVYTVERHRPLLKSAEARFRALKLHNIVVRHGDGLQGWPEQAPFDRIILTAALSEIPPALIDQLKPGGILVGPLSSTGGYERISQHLVKIIRTEAGPARETLIPVAFVPMLPGLPQEARTSDEKEKGT